MKRADIVTMTEKPTVGSKAERFRPGAESLAQTAVPDDHQGEPGALRTELAGRIDQQIKPLLLFKASDGSNDGIVRTDTDRTPNCGFQCAITLEGAMVNAVQHRGNPLRVYTMTDQFCPDLTGNRDQ